MYVYVQIISKLKYSRSVHSKIKSTIERHKHKFAQFNYNCEKYRVYIQAGTYTYAFI